MFSNHQLYRRRKLAAPLTTAAVTLLFANGLLLAQVGLGLSPMRAELRLAPGQTYTGALRLVNEGERIRVRTSLLDFHLDSEQTPQFEEHLAGESAYTCRNWLSVNPMETELNVKGDTVVRYTLRVPAIAQPRSYYCAVGFTSLPPASEISGFGIRTSVRVVGALYVIVGNPVAQGRLAGIAIEAVPGSTGQRAVVVLENAGLMFFRPTGTVAILDPAGKVLETYDITPVPILPERKQRLLFPLKVAAGQPCTIRVRVDLGNGDTQEGTAVVQAANAAPAKAEP